MKPVNSTFIQSIVALIAIFLSVQLAYSQTCITCDNNNIKAGFGNAVNSAYSNQSILGNGNTTGRNNAVAIGTASQANWSHSYVFGSSSVTNGMHAYAIGSNSTAQSTSSFAIGNYAKSMFGNAHSIGNFTTSNQVGAYVFGLGISDVYPLINNTTNSLVIGFKSQYPTLFVSETASGNQSGRVGIGNVSDPQAKLHIRADEDEEATLMLETSSRSDVSTQRIIMTNNKDLNGHLELSKNRDGRSVLTLSNIHSEGKSRIVFESFQYLFREGVVGIGTEDPRAMLDVAGEAAVDVLTIKGGYSLPSTPGNQTQFLRGDGVWAVPAGGGGGSSYWLPQGNNIYFNTGNVGIGLTNPTEKLHINGNIRLSSGFSLATNQVTAADANGLKLYSSSGSGMFVAANGSVGIGTTNTGTEFKLTVAGGIHARDVKVTLNAGSDHVFGDKHRLAPLSEVEAFVKANKHLPGVAPESEMLQQGLDVGSFQIKLLEKIEELTLYIIAQQKEIEALKAAVGKP